MSIVPTARIEQGSERAASLTETTINATKKRENISNDHDSDSEVAKPGKKPKPSVAQQIWPLDDGFIESLLDLAGRKHHLVINKSTGTLRMTEDICAAVKAIVDLALQKEDSDFDCRTNIHSDTRQLWNKLTSPKQVAVSRKEPSAPQTQELNQNKIHCTASRVVDAICVVQGAIERFEEKEKDADSLSQHEKEMTTTIYCVLTFALTELVSRCNPLPTTPTALPHLRFGPIDQPASWVTKSFCATLWTILRAHGWTVWIPASELPLACSVSSSDESYDLEMTQIAMPPVSQDSQMFEPEDTTTSGLLLKSMQTLCCLLAIVPSHRLPKDVVSGSLKSFLLEVCRTDALPSMRVVKGLNMVAHLVPLLFAPVFCNKLHVLLQRLHSLKQQSKETCRLALFVVDTFACLASHKMFDCHKIFSPFLEAALAMECAIRDHTMQEKYSLVPLLVHLLSEHPKRATEVLLRQRRFANAQVQQQCNALVQELIAECRVEVTNVVLGHLPLFRFDFAIAGTGSHTHTTHPASDQIWRDMCDMEIHVCCEDSDVKHKAVFQVHGIVVVSKSRFFNNVLMSGFRESVSGSGKHKVEISDQHAWAIHTVLHWMYSSCAVHITASQTQSTNINKDKVRDKVMVPSGSNSTVMTMLLSIDDALDVFQTADFLGVDELCGLLGAEFCRSAITLATVTELTFIAMRLTCLGVRFGPRLLRRCHQFALQHPHELVGTPALLAGLLCVEHNADRMSSFSQDMGVPEEAMAGLVFDEDQLQTIAASLRFASLTT